MIDTIKLHLKKYPGIYAALAMILGVVIVILFGVMLSFFPLIIPITGCFFLMLLIYMVWDSLSFDIKRL